MKVMDVLAAVKNLKESQYDDATLMRWIAEIEAKVKQEILKEPVEETLLAGMSPQTELCIPFPHDGIYVKWVCAQIDYHNAEYDRYNNGLDQANGAIQDFADYYTRSAMPKQNVAIKI